MHPSRAVSGSEATTSSGSKRTKVPWHERALRWPVTSTTKARSPTPIWGAARPTHPGETRMVSTRSTPRRRASSSTVPTGRAGVVRTGWGRVTTGRTGTAGGYRTSSSTRWAWHWTPKASTDRQTSATDGSGSPPGGKATVTVST